MNSDQRQNQDTTNAISRSGIYHHDARLSSARASMDSIDLEMDDVRKDTIFLRWAERKQTNRTIDLPAPYGR
jgi:hypothetical protein